MRPLVPSTKMPNLNLLFVNSWPGVSFRQPPSEKKTESTFAKRDYRDSPGLVAELDRSGNGGSSGAALLMTGSTLSGTIIASCVRRRESA